MVKTALWIFLDTQTGVKKLHSTLQVVFQTSSTSYSVNWSWFGVTADNFPIYCALIKAPFKNKIRKATSFRAKITTIDWLNSL